MNKIKGLLIFCALLIVAIVVWFYTRPHQLKVLNGGTGIVPIGVYSVLERQVVTPAIVDNNDWKSYHNTAYSITFKYPSDWQFINNSNQGMIGDDTFALIPSALKNNYCDIEKETAWLIGNYKEWNPFVGYEKYATTLSKAENCSIRFRVEQNPERLSIHEYLKEKYIPLAQQSGVAKTMMDAIVNLNTKRIGNVEQVRIDYAFEKANMGFDGGSLQAIIYDEDFTHQFIFDTDNQIFFVTNNIQNDLAGNGLFDNVIKSISLP